MIFRERRSNSKSELMETLLLRERRREEEKKKREKKEREKSARARAKTERKTMVSLMSHTCRAIAAAIVPNPGGEGAASVEGEKLKLLEGMLDERLDYSANIGGVDARGKGKENHDDHVSMRERNPSACYSDVSVSTLLSALTVSRLVTNDQSQYSILKHCVVAFIEYVGERVVWQNSAIMLQNAFILLDVCLTRAERSTDFEVASAALRDAVMFAPSIENVLRDCFVHKPYQKSVARIVRSIYDKWRMGQAKAFYDVICRKNNEHSLAGQGQTYYIPPSEEEAGAKRRLGLAPQYSEYSEEAQEDSSGNDAQIMSNIAHDLNEYERYSFQLHDSYEWVTTQKSPLKNDPAQITVFHEILFKSFALDSVLNPMMGSEVNSVDLCITEDNVESSERLFHISKYTHCQELFMQIVNLLDGLKRDDVIFSSWLNHTEAPLDQNILQDIRLFLKSEQLLCKQSDYKSLIKSTAALEQRQYEDQSASQSKALEALRSEYEATKKELSRVQVHNNILQEQNQNTVKELELKGSLLKEADQQVHEGEQLRKKLHNQILDLKGSIRVFCRTRPMIEAESSQEEERQYPTISFTSKGEKIGQGLQLHLTDEHHKKKSSNGESQYNFEFNRSFQGDSTQEEVFEEISQLVQSAVDGYRVCIFAYGQTGSGKTYTMIGDPTSPGMIPRSLEQIFTSAEKMKEQGWNYSISVSMMEIYNEEYKDLLGNKLPPGKQHSVNHDQQGKTTVSHMTEVNVTSMQKVNTLLNKAMTVRSVAATQCNEHSSRSHFVFRLNIDGSNDAIGQTVNGVLNLVDLAGSERLSKSHATGDRLKETQNINKSLSALGDVILSIKNGDSHTPYRNSKLTWLLKPCLGNKSKTLMFVNVAPTQAAAPETLCSLRFASKVNQCEIGKARRFVSH